MVVAAIELIAEGGLAHATMARIGQRAGYSRGLADYHFTSKAELVQHVVDEISGWWLGLTASSQPRRGMTALAHAVRVVMNGLEQQPQYPRVLQILGSEAKSLDDDSRDVLARHDESYRRRLRHWILEAQQDGTARMNIDPSGASVIIEGMLRGAAYQWMLNPEAFQPSSLISTMLDAIAGMIGNPAGLFGITVGVPAKPTA
jgi:AcrR family transcriptional regulator